MELQLKFQEPLHLLGDHAREPRLFEISRVDALQHSMAWL